jgi:hypothetical protein
MTEFLQQLRNAARHTRAGAMNEATKYIDKAWEVLDDTGTKRSGPKFSVRALRDYLSEARFAARKGSQFAAMRALDNAMRLLDEKPAKGQ